MSEYSKYFFSFSFSCLLFFPSFRQTSNRACLSPQLQRLAVKIFSVHRSRRCLRVPLVPSYSPLSWHWKRRRRSVRCKPPQLLTLSVSIFLFRFSTACRLILPTAAVCCSVGGAGGAGSTRLIALSCRLKLLLLLLLLLQSVCRLLVFIIINFRFCTTEAEEEEEEEKSKPFVCIGLRCLLHSLSFSLHYPFPPFLSCFRWCYFRSSRWGFVPPSLPVCNSTVLLDITTTELLFLVRWLLLHILRLIANWFGKVDWAVETEAGDITIWTLQTKGNVLFICSVSTPGTTLSSFAPFAQNQV